jgi:RNA recognition motif-containing protein
MAADGDKKRISKAAKKKKTKMVAAEVDDKPEVEEEKTTVTESAEAAEETAPAPEAAPKKKKTKANRLAEMAEAADKEPREPRGVVYVGHIPEGFAEPQMRKFFSQFGKVTRLRLSRSKKNAKSKGYAFVEFEEESVAEIVANTMHKYLLFGKTLQCHLMEKSKQHPMLFKGFKKKLMNFSNMRRKKFRSTHNDRPKQEVEGQEVPCRTTRQAKRKERSVQKLKGVLANLGVDYDVDGIDGVEKNVSTAAGGKKTAEEPPQKKRKRKLPA